MEAIERIISQSGIEDQNAVSFSIISQQFNRIADRNMPIDDEVNNWVSLETKSILNHFLHNRLSQVSSKLWAIFRAGD